MSNQHDEGQKPLHIVVVGTRGFPNIQGGVETHCEMLYPLLAAQGHEVTVIGRKQWLNRSEQFHYRGVRVVPTWSPRKSGLEALVHTLLGVVHARFLGADIVHIHAVGPAFFAPFARLLGLKVVMTHHGPDYCRQKWGFLAKAFLRTGEAMGALFANRVIAISEGIRQSLKRKFHRDNCDLIFNGVVIPKPDPQSEIDSTLEKYSLLGQKYVLAVGRIVPEKGFEDLLAAMGGRSDVKVVIAGGARPTTPYSEKLKESATACGAIMTGEVDKKTLGHLYQGASLFVMPSYHEGLPIALLEAMSFGAKLLVSDIEPNKEVGLPEDCYFKTGNVFALRSATMRLLDSGAQQSFTSLLRSRYNWNSIADKIGTLYEELEHRPHHKATPTPTERFQSVTAPLPRQMANVDARLSLAKKAA